MCIRDSFKAIKKERDSKFVLLINHSKLDPLFESAGFDEIIYFRNHWDFRLKVNKIGKIDLVHGFTRRCDIIQILKKEYEFPVIISVKDTSVSSHGINPPHWYLRKELPAEKYALEHVDGIIAESLEVSHATRLFKIKSKPKRIYFPNYCEEDKNIKNPVKINDGKIHLVYVGSIRGSQDNSAEHGLSLIHI